MSPASGWPCGALCRKRRRRCSRCSAKKWLSPGAVRVRWACEGKPVCCHLFFGRHVEVHFPGREVGCRRDCAMTAGRGGRVSAESIGFIWDDFSICGVIGGFAAEDFNAEIAEKRE